MRPSGLCFFFVCGCHFVVNGSRYCSWSTETVEEVLYCPTTEARMEERKRIKNCEELANKQNCTVPQKFLYHCVLNDLETSLVEVCAPQYVINGFCAEYNIVGAVIQPHYTLKCSNVTPPCANRYDSTDAYLYGGCYAAVKNTPSTTTDLYLTLGKTNETYGQEKNISGITVGGIIGVVLAFVVISLLITLTIIYLRKKYEQTLDEQDDLEGGSNIPLIIGEKDAEDIYKLCNTANLETHHLSERIKQVTQKIAAVDKKCSIVGSLLKCIYEISIDQKHKEELQEIGDTLAKEHFAGKVIDILSSLPKQLENIENYEKSNFCYCFGILENFSDESFALATDIAVEGGVDLFTNICSNKNYSENLQKENVYAVVRSSMSILHNVSRTNGTLSQFRKVNTAIVLLNVASLKNFADKTLKVITLLTLAHLVDSNIDIMFDKTDAIWDCIEYIGRAIEPDNKERRYRGCTAKEIMEGLSKLTVIDKFRKKIVGADPLPVFLKILKDKFVKEQAITAKVIWLLSFEKDVREKIKSFKGMMEILEDLKTSEDEKVGKYVNGALFVLKEQNDVSKRVALDKNRIKNNLFISYNWKDKEVIRNIQKKIQEKDMEMKSDEKRITEANLFALMDTLDKSTIVLICMSANYKQSPKCRFEAEYTLNRNIKYVSIIVQHGYSPEGWLKEIGENRCLDLDVKPDEKPVFERRMNELFKRLTNEGWHH